MAALSAALARIGALLSPDAGGNVLMPQTPPQFDNSQKLVNSAFLQRALGNYAGSSSYNAAATQPASDFGKLIWMNPASAFNLQLPSFANVPQGASMTYVNTSTTGANVTLLAGAGMSFHDLTNTGLTSWVIKPGQSVTFVFQGTVFMAASGFGSSFLGGSGWSKNQNGVIEQWGTVSGSSGGYTTASFPLAFPNGCFNVVGAVQSQTLVQTSFQMNSKTRTGFNFAMVQNGAYGTQPCDYRAIGW